MPRRRSAVPLIADIGLTVAAVLGAVCIALVIAAIAFDVRIILFSTGSMSPTIPAGSAAAVRTIPAADIRVGDVVTVERDGSLPITHRVVDLAAVPGTPAARSIVLRGDANRVADPAPYEVTQVQLTVFAVPGIAPVIAALGNPILLGGLTLGATTLVVVVFWPRGSTAPREEADTSVDTDTGPRIDERRRGPTASGGVA